MASKRARTTSNSPPGEYVVSVYDYATPGCVLRAYYPCGRREDQSLCVRKHIETAGVYGAGGFMFKYWGWLWGLPHGGVPWVPHGMNVYGYQQFIFNMSGNEENERHGLLRFLIEFFFLLVVSPVMRIAMAYFTKPIDAIPHMHCMEPPPHIKKWPIVVFSHGLAGHRASYSEICTRLASRGVFVAALEHMDGSASMSAVCDGKHVFPKWRPYRHTSGMKHIRQEQLEQRAEEVAFAWEKVISRWAIAKLTPLNCAYWHSPKFVADKNVVHTFWNNLDAETPLLAGHSFGAATVLRCLGDSPWTAAILFDPWLLSIEPKSLAAEGFNKPAFALNSDSWNPELPAHLGGSGWNCDVWRAIQERRKNRILTLELKGATHTAHSDFPLKIGWSDRARAHPLKRQAKRRRRRASASRLLEACVDFAHGAVLGRASAQAFDASLLRAREANSKLLQEHSWE